ncbi:MAG TPA: DUF1634 domain-containing protein [Isosphaeraceae bacterium]|jgi:uncharacterized membrane protein|nr:DUF1634 domain-containing protein [Isosphaeraceae bacterium]
MPSLTSSHQHKLERWVHLTLLGGLTVSALLLTLGLVVSYWKHERRPFRPPPPPSITLQNALHGRGPALIDLGLLTLIGTPVLRVVVLGLGWLLDREFRFAAVALLVFCLLCLSLVLGLG